MKERVEEGKKKKRGREKPQKNSFSEGGKKRKKR